MSAFTRERMLQEILKTPDNKGIIFFATLNNQGPVVNIEISPVRFPCNIADPTFDELFRDRFQRIVETQAPNLINNLSTVIAGFGPNLVPKKG